MEIKVRDYYIVTADAHPGLHPEEFEVHDEAGRDLDWAFGEWRCATHSSRKDVVLLVERGSKGLSLLASHGPVRLGTGYQFELFLRKINSTLEHFLSGVYVE